MISNTVEICLVTICHSRASAGSASCVRREGERGRSAEEFLSEPMEVALSLVVVTEVSEEVCTRVPQREWHVI